MPASSLLIGDIGGTNARFALACPEREAFEQQLTLACRDFESADAAIRNYLEQAGAAAPTVICLAAAGPVVDGRVRFTNNHWHLDTKALALEFGTDQVRLLNDFEAIAYSIPSLDGDDCFDVGLAATGLSADADFTVGIIGPGTGLGAAGLLRRGGRLLPIVGEGGHVGFAPESAMQLRVLKRLRDEFDRVSDERLVSGPGLENIYRALASVHGDKAVHVSASEIFARAAAGEDPRAGEALQLFYEALGQVAGNLALTLGAADGIYIAGGIVKRDPERLANSRFRSAFEAKGRHRSLMERIPTRVIMHPEPGLLGASRVARAMAGRH